MNGFWSEFLFEGLQFIFLIIVAACGIFAGIALRKRKDKKEAGDADASERK